MQRFTRLFNELDQTTKTNQKVEALVDYFRDATEEDKIWTIALLSGKRPPRSVNTNFLRAWAAEVGEIPDWLFEESYHVVGDLAETISLIFPQSKETTNQSLTYWINFLKDLKNADEEEKKKQVVGAWLQMAPYERFVFNKLITGGFRVGVSQKLMVRALARHTGIEENRLAHKLMGNWQPENIDFGEFFLSDNPEEDLSKPYPFYLAYALEGEAGDLGDTSLWLAERKWDGIRGQVIVRNQNIYVWSRGEELITEKFPEFEVLRDKLPDGTVIDGEILAFKEGKPLPFNYLQTRIGRKNVSRKVLSNAPVIMMAYDLLETSGEDIRNHPLTERRENLETLVEQADAAHVLKISEVLHDKGWDDLALERQNSRKHHSEGLMLKRKDSTYKVGRKRGDWWKWKVDPMTIDAVMIYAMRGHGRRANLYTDYTFAVWDKDQLVPFTKAYSGLTDQEIRRVDAFVKKNTIERFGPVRSVKPELVFEIAFEGINKSGRHKSGVALRFPRMHRWRKDKPASEANTLQDLYALLEEP